MTHFKVEANKLENKNKKYKMLTTTLKSFDTLDVSAASSTSVTIRVMRVGSIVKPISTRVACGLTISKGALSEIVVQNYI